METNSNVLVIVENDIAGLVERFGEWVSSEFNSAAKLYDELTELEKEAANWAYGLIAVINANLDKDATLIIPLIQTAYPKLSLDVVHGFIDTVLTDLNIFQQDVPLTLEDAIKQLAGYLKTLKGIFWGAMSQTIGNCLVILFSPETPIQKIAQLAETIYQMIVKPHVVAVLPSAA